MRHKKKGRKFTKSKDQRRALLRSLSSSLILEEKITTTEAKAKELRSFVEKFITRAKKDTVANRRLLVKDFSNKVIKKMFQELGSRYKSRAGGYTRITKISPRKSDGARMAVIELIK
jgi:large subunit ribosomal protein L17